MTLGAMVCHYQQPSRMMLRHVPQGSVFAEPARSTFLLVAEVLVIVVLEMLAEAGHQGCLLLKQT
jgi:hypothetical protein